MFKMDQNQLANPFASATVVVADQFVDTFPHPQGLLAYLHRLCLQLDVDIVSLDRPVIVKGSWKTIIKIDAFLKMLISSLHSAILEGAVPSEEDFSAAFSQFEEEGSSRSESTDNKHTSQDILLSNELTELKTDDYLDIIKTDEGRYDANIIMDKWYFNSNLRGKTMDKRKRNTDSGKQPPEPYVIVEADDTSKTNKANLTEIEHVLSQVYRKETIEKYQKRSTASGCNKNTQPAVFSFDFAKEEIVHVDVASPHNSEEQCSNVERKTHTLMENTSSNSLTHVRKIISSKELKRLEINLNCEEKEAANISEISEPINDDKYSRPVRLRFNRNRFDRNETAEVVDNNVAVLKKHRRGGRRRKKSKGSSEDVKQVSNCKPTKHGGRVKEMLPIQTQRVSRRDKKANSENISNQVSKKNKTNSKSDQHKINKKAANKQCKLVGVIETKTENKCISINESRVESETSVQMCNQEGNVNEDKKNNIKKETPDDQYSCDQCSYSTSKHVQLLEHKRRVHLTRKFRCEECLKEFGFLKDLRRHMKCHTKAENCCDICGKMYKEVRKLIEHKRIHADGYVKPKFPCKFCLKIFSTKYVLAYHIKADHLGMKRSYMCPTCGKSFSQKNSYLQHANVHLGIRPFTCDICGKRFSYEKSLKEHTFMHNEEKGFFCSLCKKSFRQASGLAIHLKVHKATKDYVCSMCGKGFNQKQALVRHERIHAGDKPYECVLCKRTFADSSVLRRHMILIHKKDPKMWREDTKCNVTKRTDFFISVLNGDISRENDSELKINGGISSANNAQFKSSELCGFTDSLEHQKQQQSEFYRQKLHAEQFHLQRQHLEESVETLRSLPITSGLYDSTNNKKFPLLDQTETAVGDHGSYIEGSYADMKPSHVGLGSENAIGSREIIRSIGTAENHVRFSVSEINSPIPLEKHGSVPESAHQVKAETYQQHLSFSAHRVQPAPNCGPDATSFVPHSGQVTLSSCTPHSGQVSSSSFVPHSGQVSSSSSSFVPHSGQDSSSSFVPHSGQVTSSSCTPHSGQVSSSSFVPHSGQVSSSSCVPGAYQGSQFTYDTEAVEIPPAQYSAITQSYAQTIVLLQDSLGTLTCHQSRLAFPGDNTVQAANLQHINSSLSITPARLPQAAAMSALPSGQMYSQVLSTNHHLPQ